MKVLHITNMFPFKDNPHYGIFVKNQIDSLKAKGIEARVACIGREFGGYRKILNFRDDVFWADLIHCHFGHTGSMAVIFKVARGRPLVVSYCGDDLLGGVKRNGRYHLKGKVLAWINSFLSHHIDFAVVKSDALFRRVKTKKATVIPNGVDIDLFRPMDKQAAREKIGLKDYPGKILFFLGQKENPVKNYALFKEATKLLGCDFKELFLEGLPYEEIVYYLAACDVCVLTSLHEGSSNALKEAMACNKPIVTVKAGDAQKLLDNAEGCFVVDYNPIAVAKAIGEAWEIKESRARDIIIKNGLDLMGTADKLISVYTGLIRKG